MIYHQSIILRINDLFHREYTKIVADEEKKKKIFKKFEKRK